MAPSAARLWPRLRRAGVAAAGGRGSTAASGCQRPPWEPLWSRLCHQESVYTASYAAAPHLVEIAGATRGPIDFSLLLLPTCIEISRRKDLGPPVPASLVEGYHLAISRLSDCVFRHASEEWDDNMARVAAAALVVCKGHTVLGDAIVNLDPDTIAKIVNDEL